MSTWPLSERQFFWPLWFFYSASHTNAPFVGASDMSPLDTLWQWLQRWSVWPSPGARCVTWSISWKDKRGASWKNPSGRYCQQLTSSSPHTTWIPTPTGRFKDPFLQHTCKYVGIGMRITTYSQDLSHWALKLKLWYLTTYRGDVAVLHLSCTTGL